MRTLLLTRSDVRHLLDITDTLEVVEEAFTSFGRAEAQMPPKTYVDVPDGGGDLRVMPADIPSMGAFGTKLVTVYPVNREHSLPTVMALIVLNDRESGFPLAIIDGTLITDMRTGAAGAVAAKYLARADSVSVGLIGAGSQARAQLSAIRKVFDISEVKIWSRDTSLALKWAAEMSGEADLEVEVCPDVRSACQADIVCTTTPSRTPLVEAGWIAPGTHVNAIGADAAGKQELASGLLASSVVVVDAWEQARHSGEINIPVAQGIFDRGNVYAELGEIVCGAVPGRTDDSAVTVFDSTGLAVQDVSVARRVYERALEARLGTSFDFGTAD